MRCLGIDPAKDIAHCALVDLADSGVEVKRSWQRTALMRRIEETCSAITSERINLRALSDERLKQLDDLFAALRAEVGK